MSKMKEMQIVIEEVARVALEDAEMRSRIGHELDLSDEYLAEVGKYLDGLLKKDELQLYIRRKQMSEVNNFVYLVMQHDISMGKEWVMYAYDTFGEAEDTVKQHNEEDGSNFPRYFVKSVRYFRKGGKP